LRLDGASAQLGNRLIGEHLHVGKGDVLHRCELARHVGVERVQTEGPVVDKRLVLHQYLLVHQHRHLPVFLPYRQSILEGKSSRFEEHFVTGREEWRLVSVDAHLDIFVGLRKGDTQNLEFVVSFVEDGSDGSRRCFDDVGGGFVAEDGEGQVGLAGSKFERHLFVFKSGVGTEQIDGPVGFDGVESARFSCR
jgi:hypothetical protein